MKTAVCSAILAIVISSGCGSPQGPAPSTGTSTSSAPVELANFVPDPEPDKKPVWRQRPEPLQPPDLERGLAGYKRLCGGCHGMPRWRTKAFYVDRFAHEPLEEFAEKIGQPPPSAQERIDILGFLQSLPLRGQYKRPPLPGMK